MLGMMIPPDILLLLIILLDGLCFLFFYMKKSIGLSWPVKKNVFDFYGNCIESVDFFGKVTIITVLIKLIQEHGISFLLMSSLIDPFKNLKFLLYGSTIFLIRVTPKYFTLFVTIVKCIVSLIYFPLFLSFI